MGTRTNKHGQHENGPHHEHAGQVISPKTVKVARSFTRQGGVHSANLGHLLVSAARVTLLSVAAALLFCAWFFRYDVTPIASGDGMGGAYILDRWTGDVRFLRGFQMNQAVPPNPR